MTLCNKDKKNCIMNQSLTSAFHEEVTRCFTFEECLKNVGDQVRLTDGLQNFDSKQCLESLLNIYTFPPIHWFHSSLYGAFMEALGIKDRKHSAENYNLDVLEDEDISYAFDHHSLVTSQLPDSYDDIVQTADEIIKEIDILMNNEDIPLSLCSMVQSECEQAFVSENIRSSWLHEEALQDLSLNELNAVLEELESCVREYSAILVQELAYREELDFEQEQKDIFIARLNELHRRLERKRRLSVPPDSHLQMLSNSIKMNDYGGQCSGVGQNAQYGSKALSSGTVQKETVQFILRAQSAAQAAVAATSCATVALKRHFQRLSTFSKDVAATVAKQQDARDPIHTPSILSEKDNRTYSTTTSARAIAISRLRKWASRKLEGSSGMGQTNSFRAFLRRRRQQKETATNIFLRSREARSAVTSPTSSHCDFPSIPTNLTHSASGHLIGRPETSSDDLEYKYLTTSVPYHRSPYNEGPTVNQLELFNEMLLAILTNNPNLTPMLTDYILNVYAPADRRLSKLPL
uniref:Zygin n=1 Tax=Trichobilharzia regenti TaxID=157069 RepID=A0AA85JUF2_TRIRE|nr:unnamed protein product [Trichobilharzia regenti]